MNKWTRKRILDSFTALVAEHGYDHVTVEMIMRRAEVSKTTFYRYFHDKASVMDEHYREQYDAALASKNCRNLEDLFTLLLKRIRENPDELSMFDTIGIDSYQEFIYRYTFERGRQILEAAWGRPLTSSEEFHVAFFCGGGARIMGEWVCGRYREMTAEQAGHEIGQMVSPKYNVMIDKEKLKDLEWNGN
jgi:AcrR family transcriptional regulator